MPIDSFELERLLLRVQKPARYVGGEWNSIRKDPAEVEVTLALGYPDVYEIGMSNLGLSILYDAVNADPLLAVERVYAPWDDMEREMRAAGLPLFTLESRLPVAEVDVFGLTLQTELTFSNVLNMLDLAGLPLRSSARDASHPLVIVGGSCCYNPEPMAPFIDAFVIGEGEQVLVELLHCVRRWKNEGRTGGRQALFRALAQIDGVYVPSLYDITYRDDGTIQQITPLGSAPVRVVKRITPRLAATPRAPVVPNLRVVHDRAAVEIQRGCGRGCRFCQAGMIYRPIRERPAEEVIADVDAIIANTGYDEVGLVSLSSSDHSGIQEIVRALVNRSDAMPIAVSLPSLRIDSFSLELAELIQQQRKTGFTFAPEAGSQRLRDVINKGVTEEDLLRTAEAAFENGWDHIKLYFMLGLPTETDEDAREMARLIRTVRAIGRRLRGRRAEVSASVATFVPKAHSPFQWLPLVSREELQARQRVLLGALGPGRAQVSYSEWSETWLEALLSRGDRRLADVIEAAWRAGARFDAWSELADVSRWHRALEECGIDPAFYLERPRSRDEILPWSTIDAGVSDAFLWDQWECALSGELSPDCRSNCHDCGILVAFASEHSQVDPVAWGCPP
ncbi:MAG: TIGR03960 family B12-binding radical SAM protein [Anaerolineae bacterium]